MSFSGATGFSLGKAAKRVQQMMRTCQGRADLGLSFLQAPYISPYIRKLTHRKMANAMLGWIGVDSLDFAMMRVWVFRLRIIRQPVKAGRLRRTRTMGPHLTLVINQLALPDLPTNLPKKVVRFD
jgi:hypothetical protein